jgi:hypothetical protein
MAKNDFKNRVLEIYRMRTHPKKVSEMTREERILIVKGIVLEW